jgi:hypothetical protein
VGSSKAIASRGGDRELNWALHVIALHRIQPCKAEGAAAG